MNIPGILSLKAIRSDLINLPFLFNGITITEIAHDSASLTEIEFIPETCGIKVSEKLTANGLSFQIALSLKTEGVDNDLINLLNLASTIPHLFIATDKNGNHYLIGTQNQSNDAFNYKLNNDAAPTGGRYLSITITSLSSVFPVYTQ